MTVLSAATAASDDDVFSLLTVVGGLRVCATTLVEFVDALFPCTSAPGLADLLATAVTVAGVCGGAAVCCC